MKKTLITLLILTSFASKGQDLDSLKREIIELKLEQEYIKVHLEKHHDQYSLGAGLLIGGLVMLGVDLAIRNNDDSYDTPAFLIVSSASIVAGTVITIDSHKWIGRAGRRRK